MGKDMMSKIRAGDVWKALSRVLDEFRIPKSDYDVLDRRPHPHLIVRYCGAERFMSFPCTPHGHGRAPYKYSSSLRRMLKEMQMSALGTQIPEEVNEMKEQTNLPLFAGVAKQHDNQSYSNFDFEGKEVRIIVRGSEPWFVLADVCRVLEVKQPHHAAARLDDDEKDRVTITTLGGSQEMTVINESGLYSLILTSRKEEAKRFKKWVTSDVLPSIRHTGSYGVPALDYSDPKVVLGVLNHLQELVLIKDGVIAVQGERLKTLDRIEAADGSMCITDAAKTLNTSPTALIKFMQSRSWIYKRTGSKNWIGYQEKLTAGYLEHDEYLYLDSERRERVSTRVLVTAKGLVKLAKLLEQPLH